MSVSLLDVFLYIILYSFFGWCGEEIYHTVTYGDFTNRGFVNGPVCTIYGIGFAGVIVALSPIADNLPLLFLGSMILTTSLELVTGWALEKIFHTKWWDYSKEPFNIGGYVCLKFAILWGLVCTTVIGLIQPKIEHFCHYFSERTRIIFVCVCFVIYLCDYTVTVIGIRKIQVRMRIATGIAEHMNEIAVTLGEGLYEGTKKTMEISDEVEKRSTEAKETLERKGTEAKEAFAQKEMEAREGFERVGEELRIGFERKREELAELRTKLAAMKEKPHSTYRRLEKAFPGLEMDKRLSELEKRVNRKS